MDVLERVRINPIETYVGTNRLRWFEHVSWMPASRISKYLLTSTPARLILNDLEDVQGGTGRNVIWRTWQHFQGIRDANILLDIRQASKHWREMIRQATRMIEETLNQVRVVN